MKKMIAVFALVLSSLVSFSQDSISVVQRSWAGGICCSSGVDFTLNIPVSMDQRNIEGLWLYVPGFKIYLSEKALHESNKNCTATFGWSSNGYDMDVPYIHYYGVTDQEVIYTTDFSEHKVVLLFTKDKEKTIPVKFTEEIVAYP